MPANLVREGDELVLYLKGAQNFQAALAVAKATPGRRYNPEDKTWRFEAKPLTAQQLIHAIHPTVGPDILGWIKAELSHEAEHVSSLIPAFEGELAVPWAERLYGFQRDAVAFGVEHPRLLLADEMGLGKTIEAVSIVEELWAQDAPYAGFSNPDPRLVIAPASMVRKWAKEIEEWTGQTAVVIESKLAPAKRTAALREAAETPGAWVIVNWEQIRAQKVETGKAKPKYAWQLKQPLFGEIEWAAVIADEAHRAKNKDAQQTRGLWQLHSPVQLALTGTPILNSPDEIWSLLAWLRPEQYGEYHRDKVGYWRFFEQYVDYYEGHYGRIITGVKNADALRFELKDKLVRRTKGQVLDLPEKVRTTIPLALHPKQRKLYDEALSGLTLEIETALGQALKAIADIAREDEWLAAERLIAAAKDGDIKRLVMLIPNAAARIVRMRQIVSSPALLGAPDDSAKLDAAVDLIVDHPDQQFVVFSEFRETTRLLEERLSKRKIEARCLTGDTPIDSRETLVADFQAGEFRVFISTIKAGGVGLTLTAAQTAIFIERDWTPAINEQAEDRLHRIGQQQSVSILILEAQNTVDDGNVAPANRVKELIVKSVITADEIKEEISA